MPSSAEGGVTTKHKPLFFDGTLVCKVCFATAKTPSSIANFAFAKCKGPVAMRVAESPASRPVTMPGLSQVHSNHSIVVTSNIAWCTKCLLYAEHRLHKLAAPCTGRYLAHRRDLKCYESRLCRGQHPRTGRTLPVLEALSP